MTQINDTPFIIRPPDDLCQQQPELLRMAQELARAYAERKLVTNEALQAMGRALWQAVATDVATAQAASGVQILPLIIESDEATVQQLPWETLYHPTLGFVGLHPALTLYRRMPSAPPRPTTPLSQGPLRVLLFTSMPEGLEEGRLEVEREQETVQAALLPFITDGRVLLEMPHDGRVASLAKALRDFEPHLLFLSGHGNFYHQPHRDEPPYGTFLFEDELGQGEEVTEADLARLFIGSTVQAVVLSACQSGQASSEHLSHGLTRCLSQAGIPHVIGMRESVLDRAGILFAEALAEAVARREPLDVALQRARQAITKPLAEVTTWREGDKSGLTEQSLGQWCLPLLMSHQASRPLIDWNFTPQPPTRPLSQQLMAGITLPPTFIGRRRELRALQVPLANGTLRQLLITGPGGQGKTALAGKLSQLMAQQGYLCLALSAQGYDPWGDFMFEVELALTASQAEKYNRMVPRCVDETAKAKLLLRLLMEQTQHRLLLFFDNLESVQTVAAPHGLTDERLLAWLTAAHSLRAQGLILLVTSRWLLPTWPSQEAGTRHWLLAQANYGDFLTMAPYQGLPRWFSADKARLRQLWQVLHGNGRGLHFFSQAIQGMTTLEEAAFLAKLAQASAELQMTMALSHIISPLDEATRGFLCQSTAYSSPVPQEGLLLLGQAWPDPAALLQRLLAVSLLEQSENPRYQATEYFCSPVVVAWLKAQAKLTEQAELVDPPTLRQAAAYQRWLFENERYTLSQAIITHAALRRAQQREEAHRFALDEIVGSLNMAGLYHTLLTEWLPEMCLAEDAATRAEALGQTGKQYHHVGDYETALPYYEQSLTIHQHIGDKAGEGTTLNNISQIYQAQGDYETALRYLTQSLTLFQQIGNKAGEGTTLNNISQIYQAQGDYETAVGYLRQSLTISQQIGDIAGEGTTLNNLATLYQAQGDYETAMGYLRQSLTIQQQLGDIAGRGATLNNLATLYHAQGDYETAMGYLRQSLTIQQQLGDKAGEDTTLNNLATLYQAQGDYETALKYLTQSLTISQQIGDIAGEGTTLNNIGKIYHAQGDYETAMGYLRQSLTIQQQLGDKAGEGTTLNNLATLYQAQGDYETALKYLTQSLTIRQQIGDKKGEGTTLGTMAVLSQAQENYDDALNYMEQSLTMFQDIGDIASEGTTLNNMATLSLAQGDYETALKYLTQSMAISQQIGDKVGLCTTLFNLGHIYLQNEQPQEALQAWVTVYRLASQMGEAQALQALEGLAGQLGLPGGLAGWAALAERIDKGAKIEDIILQQNSQNNRILLVIFICIILFCAIFSMIYFLM